MRRWKEEEIVVLSEVDYVVQLINDHHLNSLKKKKKHELLSCWCHVTEQKANTKKSCIASKEVR